MKVRQRLAGTCNKTTVYGFLKNILANASAKNLFYNFAEVGYQIRNQQQLQ